MAAAGGLNIIEQIRCAHRPACFAEADLNIGAWQRGQAEVMIETDHPINLGARPVNGRSNRGQHLFGDKAEMGLHIMQDGNEVGGVVAMLRAETFCVNCLWRIGVQWLGWTFTLARPLGVLMLQSVILPKFAQLSGSVWYFKW